MKKIKITLTIVLLFIIILSGNCNATESNNTMQLNINNAEDKITKTEITYSDRVH